MPIDINRLNDLILEQPEPAPTGDFQFEAEEDTEETLTPNTPQTQVLPRADGNSDLVGTNAPTIEGARVEQSVQFDENDSFYDVETDMVRPGASWAHKINEQYARGVTDLSLDDPQAVDWDSKTDEWAESFHDDKIAPFVPGFAEHVTKDMVKKASALGAVVGHIGVEIGRGLVGSADVINRAAGGLAFGARELVQGAFDPNRTAKEVFGDAYDELLSPLTETPGGVNRKDFLNEFNDIAQSGDSFALIDLVQSARGRPGEEDPDSPFRQNFKNLTTTEKNQLIAQFEGDATMRQIAMDSLSYSAQQMMLKYTADRWTHGDTDLIDKAAHRRADISMDVETYFRESISQAAANEQWGKAAWLTTQQSVVQLAPAVISMWASGGIGAASKVKGAAGAVQAAAPKVVTRAGIRFSPTLLKTAPKSGLVMAMITPGTAEEKLKTGAVMTAYAASGSVSELFSTFGRRWAVDMAINTAASAVINPAGEHMVQWGGMYREMYRNARYEAERLGLDPKNSNALTSLYLAGIAVPDAIFGGLAAAHGRAMQPAVRKSRIEFQAREHWLRREWEGRLRQTAMKPEERESFLDNSMKFMAVQADLQNTTVDALFAENFDNTDGNFGIEVRESGGEIVAELKSRNLDFQPQNQGGDPSRVDTNFGDPRARAIQDLVMYQRGVEGQSEFHPAAVGPDAVQQHADALNMSVADGAATFKQYQDHPEFSKFIEDNDIRDYDQLVEHSYQSLRHDIDDIFPLMGVKVVVHDGPGQPYKDMKEAMQDMQHNRTLRISRSESDHPQLGAERGISDGLSYSDKLKAIRMYFGHSGGSHDATPAGIRNAQARVSQMLSDSGNIAFATEGGLAAGRFGPESLGVKSASNRVEDGTAAAHDLPSEAEAQKKAVMFGNQRVEQKHSVAVLDPLVRKGDATEVVKQFIREQPNADPKLFAETYAHHTVEVAKVQARLDEAAAKGDFDSLNDIAQELINAQILQQSYREAAELLSQAQGNPREIAPDLLEATPGTLRAEAAVLPPGLADWRAGLVPKAQEGVLQRLVPELLRPLKQRKSANQLAVAKAARVTQLSNSVSSPANLAAVDSVLKKYDGKSLTDKKTWENFWFDLTGDTEIPVFAEGFRQVIEGGSAGVTKMIRGMSAEQIKDFTDGIRTTEEIKQSYQNKNADLETTALVSLWGALSPGLNNYPHESAFMEVLLGSGRMKEFIRKAEKGTFNEDQYLKWVEAFYKKGGGKAGVKAKTNMNNFGKKFLKNMYRPIENGKYKGERPIQVLHRLLSDPEVSGKQLRREWYNIIDPKSKVGIDIKVLSFMGLIAGKRDVMVIDRIQTQHLWDMEATYGFKNGYDGIPIPQKPRFNKDGTPLLDDNGGQVLTKKNSSGMADILSGHRAIALYEKMESELAPVAAQGLADAGLADTSLGSWHWASWVSKGNQEVSHSSLVGMQRMMDGVDDPFVGSSVVNGKFNTLFYGFKNVYFGKLGGNDFRHVYTTQEGVDYIMDTKAMKKMRHVADLYKNSVTLKSKSKKQFVRDAKGKRIEIKQEDRTVPANFKYTQEETANGTPVPTDRPWTERDDVNLPNFDKWVTKIGVRPDAQEAKIIASGSNSTGLARPGRGIDEIRDTGSALAQEQPSTGLQGATAFFKNGKKLIFLLKNADVATAHHEFFHVLFDMLPPEVKQQVEPILKQHGIDLATEGFSPRALEVVTRQYERYLFDGEAPTPDMTGMFSIISKHMRQTYRTVMGSPISSEVSPEAKQFFDSLYVPEGTYVAPHAGYIQREEQEMFSLIEGYDSLNDVKRKDPQEVGAMAQDIGRLRHELGVNEVNMDVAARAASGLPIGTVSYRAGRKVYRRLLRSILSETAPLDDAFVDQLATSWVRSGNAQGNKTLQTLSTALKDAGIEPRKVNQELAKVVEQYAKTKAVPASLEPFKRQVGQTTRSYKAWIRDAVDNVQQTRDQRGFKESGVLKSLVDGDLAQARRLAKQQVEGVEGVTNALGGYNKHQPAQFEGTTVGQTKDVREQGHKVLIPEQYGDDAGYFHSDTSLSNSTHDGKPVVLYAYHQPSRQLIPGREGQLFERLTELIPNSKSDEWVRIDVSGDGDLVGTSGNRNSQVEAYSALRATDPNIRWVPDAQQVVGFYGIDGKVLNNAQFTPDGAMGDYVVFPKDKLDLFDGAESVVAADVKYNSPEFQNYQRRVKTVVEPQAARDFFHGLDSAAIDPKIRRGMKNKLMTETENVLGVDHIDATNLKAAMPGKNKATTRNMILAIDRGGSISEMVKHFNNLQDQTGGRTKIRGLDLTDLSEVKKRFEIGEAENAAIESAADISNMSQQFFRDLIESGRIRFPDEAGSAGHQEMVRMLVHIGKKRSGAVKREAALGGINLRDKNLATMGTAARLATNARYAWNRLGAEIGNLEIGRVFGGMTLKNRRGSRNIETRYQGFFNGDNIKEALVRNGKKAPQGKVKDQLYSVIRSKDSQDAIARWLGTEPGDTKKFKQAQVDFDNLPPAHQGVGYLIREELQGASAANLRSMQHHVWSKTWDSVREEYQQLKTGKKLTEADQKRFDQITSQLLDSSPFRRGIDEAERVSVDEMIEIHNKFLTSDASEFHEFLKTQDWGARKNYWLTVRPEEYDSLLKQFTAPLDPLPTASKVTTTKGTGMPGSIKPRTSQKVELQHENILNNLFQHMHRYEILATTQRDAEFLREKVDSMKHLTDYEIKILDRNLMNMQGFGEDKSLLAFVTSKANRWFWNSYILNSTRLVWYTVRNKVQPYALGASQFPISEIVKAIPEWKRDARNKGSLLRKANGETFQSDIAENGAFARQALTDTSTDTSTIKTTALGQHMDTFMNSALPFSDKMNRNEVYGLAYTIANRAQRDFQNGKIDQAELIKRTGLRTMDPSEQLSLMSKINSGDAEGFRREYARLKNLNINFAYRTGERALFLQGVNTRTFASLSTWPLGATEIVVRNGIKPIMDGISLGDKTLAIQGAKSLAGYMMGMYLVGETYSLIFGDKGEGKAYDPIWSALSPSIESPGQGWMKKMLDDGPDVLHQALRERDFEGTMEALKKLTDGAMYMIPMLSSIVTMYEAVQDQSNLGISDMGTSLAMGISDSVAEWMESDEIFGETQPGFGRLVVEAIQARLESEGYSQYRTAWEAAMHFILGTFEESDPERWDRSVVGKTIHAAIEEAVEAASKYMDPEEFEKTRAKLERTHDLRFEDFGF